MLAVPPATTPKPCCHLTGLTSEKNQYQISSCGGGQGRMAAGDEGSGGWRGAVHSPAATNGPNVLPVLPVTRAHIDVSSRS